MSKKMSTPPWFAAMAMAATLVLGPAGPAVGASHVTQGLIATAHAPGARGQAKLVLKSASQGRFRLIARGLAASSRFDLVIGGIKVAALTTNAGGTAKAKLSTNPRLGETLLGVDPRGETVAVRDEQGDDDLEGDIPDDTQDAAEVACCLPDDGGSECDTETPEECAAEGGAVAGIDIVSCLPNPCGAPPPGGEEFAVCCLADSAAGAFTDDDPEIECEDDTADCAGAGGTIVAATSCEENPCAPVPPSQVVVCCVPEESETECEVLTPEHCSARNGTVSDALSCEADPCGGDTTDGGDGTDGGLPGDG